MRALVYCRQSEDRTGKAAGVDRQLRECRKLVRARGWTVAGEYVDNDVSATNGKRRPQYEALMADVAAGVGDVVVAWHADRLYRTLDDLAHIVKVVEGAGATVATVQAGDVDLATASGRMVARILGAVHMNEIEHKVERQRASEDRLAEQGLPHKGSRAFGYKAGGLEVEEAEAEVVRRLFTLAAEGESMNALARTMNDEGRVTTFGKPWSHMTVRQIIRNPRYIGKRVLRGEVVGDGAWPAIVDPETFAAANRKRERLARPVDNRRRWLGTNVYVCECNAKQMACRWVGKSRGQHDRRVYQCKACGLSRTASYIDNLVLEVLAARLALPDAVDLLTQTPDPVGAAEARKRADDLRRRLDEAAIDYAEGILTREQLATITARLRPQVETAEAALAVAGARRPAKVPTGGDAEVIRARLDEMLEGGRALDVIEAVETLMTVTLHRARRGRKGFEPHTVTIEWRTA